MEIVRAGFYDHVYHRTPLADIRSEVAGLHLEFVDRFHRRLQNLESDLLFVIVETIEQEIVVCCHQTVYVNGAVTAFVLGDAALLHRADLALIDPRAEIGELHEIASV